MNSVVWNKPISGLLASWLALSPLVIAYLLRLAKIPSHQFSALMVVPGVLAIVWMKRFLWERPSPCHGTSQTVSTWFAGVLLLASGVIGSPWLGFVSFLAVTLLASTALGGPNWLRAAIPVTVFLCVLVTPPFDLDQQFMSAMQAASSRGADKLLDLLGVFHVLQGNVVSVTERRLMVAEACSGVQSLIPIMSVIAFLLPWKGRPLWQTAVVLATAPLWTVLSNSVRIALVALLVDRYHLAADTGILHAILSVSSFLVGLGLTLSFDQVVETLRRIRRQTQAEEPRLLETSTPPLWVVRSLVVASIVALGLQAPRLVGSVGRSSKPAVGVDPSLGARPLELLPETFHDFRRVDFRSQSLDRFDIDRVYSKFWGYRSPAAIALFSVDYPFADWHELTACYRTTGWIIGRRTIESVDVDGMTIPLVEVVVTKPSTGREGRLWFTLVNGDWNPVPPRNDSLSLRALHRLNPFAASSTQESTGPYVQLQLLIDSATSIDDAGLTAARRFFGESCKRVIDAQARKAPSE